MTTLTRPRPPAQVWNRAITNTELRSAQNYLTGKYGLTFKAPPTPPQPAAPMPPQAPMASSLTKGVVAWYSMASFNAATGVWASKVGSGSTTVPGSVQVVTDAPGDAFNTVPVTYLSGPSTSKIYFPESYQSPAILQFSMCAITRYTSPLAQFRMRIFQPYKSASNWLHGQWSGYSGVAYYNGWMQSPGAATTATKWVSTCTSVDTATEYFILDVNGVPTKGTLANMALPDQLTINGNTQVDAEWSAYGVAEFITWNRALSRRELDEAQAFFTTKYGIKDTAPPAPPVPAAPSPPATPLTTMSTLARGMVAWYNMASYQPATELSGTWANAVSANGAYSTPVNQIDVVTDPVGTAGNSVPITYISGPATTKIIYPEVYGTGDNLQFSICTVTRYTSQLNRMRVFQDYKSQTNFLHGHVRAPLCILQPRLRLLTCAPIHSASRSGAATAASHIMTSGSAQGASGTAAARHNPCADAAPAAACRLPRTLGFPPAPASTQA